MPTRARPRTAVRVPAEIAPAVVAATLAIMRQRKAAAEAKARAPIPAADEWIEANFWEPETQALLRFVPFQRAVLRYATMRRPDGALRWRTVVWSQPKKSGKTAISGAVGRWVAETWGSYQLVLFVGNDGDQAKERGFAALQQSVELTPGYDRTRRELPGRWRLLDTEATNDSGGVVKAIAADYTGEAGANPSLTVYTELWGFIHTNAKRFWAEMAPSPTRINSMRWVETYAGYEGESELLYGLYEATVKNGRQLTAGELAAETGTEVGVFAEAQEADDPVPVYVNEAAGMMAFWDSGPNARRMPWQQGERGAAYYANEAATQLPLQMRRLHGNEWVSAESAFVPIELWDACEQERLPLIPGDPTPLIVGLDAATTKDCFGMVVVSRDPANPKDGVAVRMVRKWTPTPGNPIQFSAPGGPEETIRALAATFNVTQFAYDPAQLQQLAIDMTKEGVGWFREFPQGQPRLHADNGLYDLILNRRLRHDGNPDLREHIANANAKSGKEEDNKLRIIKKTESRKIDLCIALSMSAAECLRLNLT